jgi:hypothetical protein
VKEGVNMSKCFVFSNGRTRYDLTAEVWYEAREKLYDRFPACGVLETSYLGEKDELNNLQRKETICVE